MLDLYIDYGYNVFRIRYDYEFWFFFFAFNWRKSKQLIKMSLLRLLFCHKVTAKPTKNGQNMVEQALQVMRISFALVKLEKKNNNNTMQICIWHKMPFLAYIFAAFRFETSFHSIIWFDLYFHHSIVYTAHTIFVFIFFLFGCTSFDAWWKHIFQCLCRIHIPFVRWFGSVSFYTLYTACVHT